MPNCPSSLLPDANTVPVYDSQSEWLPPAEH